MTRSKLWVVVALTSATAFLDVGSDASVSAKADEPHAATLTGRVVDAACYMIHPPAASIPSHRDCGAACLARGVPLAIANEKDNALYFPADGNQRLMSLLDQRVRVTGTVARESKPMELKMTVGEANQMAVRVDGGYQVVTIGSIEKVAAKRRQ
jgi:hypothetical protein